MKIRLEQQPLTREMGFQCKLVFVCILVMVCSSCGKDYGREPPGVGGGHSAITTAIKPRLFDSIFEKTGEIEIDESNGPSLGEAIRFSLGTDGRILLSDPAITRGVYLYAANGKFIRRVGAYGTRAGEFLYPVFHGFDRVGNIYVYDGDRLDLMRFDREGNFTQSVHVGKFVHKVEFSWSGDPLMFTATYSDVKWSTDATIFRYTKNGEFVKKFCPQSLAYDGRSGYYGGGIAIDCDDMVYHISPYEYRIHKFDRNGHLHSSFGMAPATFRPIPTEATVGSSRKDLEKHHLRWTHIWGILLFERGLLMIWMQDIHQLGGDTSKTRDYFDLYSSDGKLLDSGVELPREMNNYCARNDYLFGVKTTRAKNSGDIDGHSICAYKLR